MKPIEAGCKAIILYFSGHPEWIGLIVNIIKKVDCYWEIEHPDFNNAKYKYPYSPVALPQHLMRIDGFEGDEQKADAKELVKVIA